MSMSDPISDMLTRIRNGIMSRKTRVQIPASQLKERIAAIMKSEGYISDYRREGEDIGQTINIELKWTSDQQNAIEGLKRISRPGRRQYVGKDEIPHVRGGQGIAILTTSRGVLSDAGARRNAVGGEVICEVW